jgi:hypothetical protein
LAFTCLLLAISGGIRYWRDRQFQFMARESEVSPFPLNDLPKVLGTWHEVEGSDAHLDPETARVSGSSDHIIRVYMDEKSGEQVSVLALYGLARIVFAHTPEVCYPAGGYKAVDQPKPSEQQLSIPDSTFPARYKTGFYSKTVGGLTQYEEVYYTFRYNGEWVPEVASKWKMFRYRPSMFKIQTQRHTSTLSTEGSPTESLLKELIQEIDKRVSRNATHPANVKPAA